MTRLCAATFAALLFLGKCSAQETGYDREALQSLTEYRQQHRKTVDGRLCAAAFVQDDHTYTDCTTARNPEGVSGRQWCYVEVQLLGKGPRDWDYCQDVVDYDSVRASARGMFDEKAENLKAASGQLSIQSERLRDTINRYKSTCLSNDVVSGRIHEIDDTLRAADHSITELQSGLSKIKELQTAIMGLKTDIDRNAEKSAANRVNCEAHRGYEDEPVGDGLRGTYYPNARFQGPALAYSDDKKIDFVWTETSPADDIPYQHFSIRWDGYVSAPTTGSYQFITQADCGARIFLDGSPIIIDRMPTPIEGAAFTENAVRVLQPGDYTDVAKTYSQPQNLLGGKKYRLRIEYFHLSSNKFNNENSAKIALGWKSASIPEQIIPTDYLFMSNPSKSLKISGLGGGDFDMTLLENGAYAFTDSKDHYIADIPSKYEGSKLIRTAIRPTESNIEIELSAESFIYVAVPRGGSSPSSSMTGKAQSVSFEETPDTISVYLAEDVNSKATQQVPFKIYAARALPGHVALSLPQQTSYMMFFMPVKSSEHNCEGETMAVMTGSKFFNTCTSSSYASGQYDCKAGLSGKSMDLPYGAWRTSAGQPIGQYIMASFTQPIEVASVQFKPLDDPSTWPTEMTIEFPGTHDVEKITIQPGDHTYPIAPRMTNAVKATISGMRDSSSSTTGGSIGFIGSACVKAETEVKEIIDESISISFGGGASQQTPAGFKLDDGAPKAAHGDFFYGWEHQGLIVNPDLCEGASTHGGIAFPEPECSKEDACDANVDCNYPNMWSIDMPKYGSYRVTVEVGSPCGSPQINNLFVNGVPFINNEFLQPGQYSKATGDVSLTTSATISLTSSTRTTLQSIRIERLPSSILPFSF